VEFNNDDNGSNDGKDSNDSNDSNDTAPGKSRAGTKQSRAEQSRNKQERGQARLSGTGTVVRTNKQTSEEKKEHKCIKFCTRFVQIKRNIL
jgi:hypothetical protein